MNSSPTTVLVCLPGVQFQLLKRKTGNLNERMSKRNLIRPKQKKLSNDPSGQHQLHPEDEVVGGVDVVEVEVGVEDEELAVLL